MSALLSPHPPLLPAVTSLWQQVLQSSEFTADTHFFVAGGDSLQLTRVMLKLQQLCGIQLQLRDVTEFSTPRKMAAWCEYLLRVTPSSEDPQTRNETGRGYYTANAMQQGMWLAEQQAAVGLYNTAALLHLRGNLETAVLEQALSVLLHKHPVLRGTFAFDLHSRSLRVYRAPFEPVFLRADDIAGCHLAEAARQMATIPFASHEKMYRFHLFRLAREHHALLLCCHHAVTDGWSAAVMLRSLAEAYNGLLLDPSWQAQHVDTAFMRSCRDDAIDDIDASALAWWKTHLHRASLDNGLLTSTHRHMRWPFRMEAWRGRLAQPVMMAVLDLAKRQRITPFCVMLAALKLVLADQMHVPEQIVGFPVASRGSALQENSVGCYVNTLLTRDVIDGPGLSSALLRRVSESVQGALRYAMPLQVLGRYLRPTPLPSGNLWFDVLFAFQNLPASIPQFQGLQVDVENVPPCYGQYPLKLEVVPGAAASRDRSWQLCVEYAPAVLGERDIAYIVSSLQRALQLKGTG